MLRSTIRPASIAFLFSAITASAQDCGSGLDEGLRSFAAGVRPLALVAADFDGNGTMDLASAGSIDDRVHVLLGDGRGGFELAATLAVGREPAALLARDLDADGRVDLVTADRADGTLSILRGAGDGSFAERETHDVGGPGSAPVALDAGDLDGDGRPDLVVALLALDEVAILLSNEGGFGASQSVDVGGERPRALALGDVDRDGDLDLVTVNEASHDLSVFFGRGDGGLEFGESVSVNEPRESKDPLDLRLVDLDRDEDLDLLVTVALEEDTEGELLVLLREGGRFRAGEIHEVGLLPRSPLFVDLEPNGSPDVIVANTDSDDVIVLSGRGNGGFKTPRRFVTTRAPVAIVAGDFDGDLVVDLATLSELEGVISVLRGRGDRSFVTGERFEVRPGISSVATGDFDQDGDVDLVVLDRVAERLRVLGGGNDGGFQLERSLSTSSAPERVLAALVDGDEHEDFLVLRANGVEIRYGAGGARFSLPFRLDVAGARDVEVLDVDGDGSRDLLVARGTGGLELLRSTGARVFEAAITVLTCEVAALASADFEPGPTQGIAALCRESDEIVLLGWRDAAITELRRIPTGAGPVDMVASDLDGDGLPDLAVACEGASLVAQHLAADSFALSARSVAQSLVDARLVAGALRTGDSREIAVLQRGSNELHVVSTGAATAELARLTLGPRGSDLAIADIDGDGQGDLIVANDGVTIFFRTTGGGVDCDGNGVSDACELDADPGLDADGDGILDACQGGLQRPWDCTQDGRVDLTDAVCVLSALFGGGRLPCSDGDATAISNVLLIDGNPGGRVDISDAVSLLAHLFRGGPPHPMAEGASCVRLPGCAEVPTCF